jgi:hypothetical protein
MALMTDFELECFRRSYTKLVALLMGLGPVSSSTPSHADLKPTFGSTTTPTFSPPCMNSVPRSVESQSRGEASEYRQASHFVAIMLCAFSAHTDGLEVEPQNRKCDGTYPPHTTLTIPSWSQYLKTGRPVPVSAEPLTGLCLKSVCCQQCTRQRLSIQSSASNRASTGCPPNLLLAAALVIRASSCLDWASAIRRNLGICASLRPDVADAPM